MVTPTQRTDLEPETNYSKPRRLLWKCFSTPSILTLTKEKAQVLHTQSTTTDYSNYHQTKQIGPWPKEYPENEATEFMMGDVNKRHFLWCLMRYSSIDSSIPIWTGFPTIMYDKIPGYKSNIGYLDCIDAPATEILTIYQVN